MLVRPLYKENDRGCWIWQRGTSNGYGWYGRKYAHRVMYETHIGGLSKTTFLHHKCHTPMCVNPYHLEPTTSSLHQKHHQKEQSFCKNGHARSRENLYITKADKWQCRRCKAIREKARQDKLNASRRQARRKLVNSIRQDIGLFTMEEIAKRHSVSLRTVYRYRDAIPTKLGYF